MSNIRELSLDEIALVSGGNVSDRADVNSTATSNGYGAQANGFKPNYAAGATVPSMIGSCEPDTKSSGTQFR